MPRRRRPTAACTTSSKTAHGRAVGRRIWCRPRRVRDLAFCPSSQGRHEVIPSSEELAFSAMRTTRRRRRRWPNQANPACRFSRRRRHDRWEVNRAGGRRELEGGRWGWFASYCRALEKNEWWLAAFSPGSRGKFLFSGFYVVSHPSLPWAIGDRGHI